jgi:hypothetical protein
VIAADGPSFSLIIFLMLGAKRAPKSQWTTLILWTGKHHSYFWVSNLMAVASRTLFSFYTSHWMDTLLSHVALFVVTS